MRGQTLKYSQYFVDALDFSSLGNVSWWRKMRAVGQIFYSYEAKRKLEALLDAHPVDVAHIHNIYHHISPSILKVFKKRGIPVVMTVHDYKLVSPNYTLFHHGRVHEEDARGWYWSCVKNKCFKDSRLFSLIVVLEMIFHHKFKRYYEKLVAVFLAPSQFMQTMLVRHRFSPKKIRHLPLFVEAQKINQAKELKGVVYIGRLSEEKGVAVLLRAAKETPEISYTIVGTGPAFASLQTLSHELGLRNVIFTGYKTGAELESLRLSARLLVVPSIWYENYPLTVVEAKARGQVVIASAIGGIAEMLPKELLVVPGDARELASKIEYWYTKTDAQLASVGEKLRAECMKENDLAGHVGVVEEVYQKLIGQ
jgi:glycosyltransferase involved in cell wall biosynthesis